MNRKEANRSLLKGSVCFFFLFKKVRKMKGIVHKIRIEMKAKIGYDMSRIMKRTTLFDFSNRMTKLKKGSKKTEVKPSLLKNEQKINKEVVK